MRVQYFIQWSVDKGVSFHYDQVGVDFWLNHLKHIDLFLFFLKHNQFNVGVGISIDEVIFQILLNLMGKLLLDRDHDVMDAIFLEVFQLVT